MMISTATAYLITPVDLLDEYQEGKPMRKDEV
jgi:hypothetical protein